MPTGDILLPDITFIVVQEIAARIDRIKNLSRTYLPDR